jgi:hypothetical protein
MTTASSTLQSIFAVPFASVRLAQPDGLNLALAAGLNPLATPAQGDASLPTDPFCFRSREDLFEWQGEALSYLKQELLAGLCGVVRAANLYTEEQFRALGIQAKARFVIVRPNGCLPAGSLPHASWCAIYCVSAPDPNPLRPDSATLRLYSHRFGGMFLDSANWNLRQPFHFGHQLWHPIPGDMAVFPAWIPHEVALNRGDRDLMLIIARVRFADPRVEGQTLPPW